MEDKLVADTDEKKNELEAYIYELRDKLETTYAEFSSEEEKEKLRAKLTDSEVINSFFLKCYIVTNYVSGLAVRGR
jgi:vacuolar-type H+-ATPase subunit I/STV1